MVLVQNWPYILNFILLSNIGLEHVLYDILEGRNNFLGVINKKFKKSKYCIFPKRLLHSFAPKLAIFPTFFFSGNIGQENVFYDIIEQKKNILRYKNKKFKKSTN